MENSIKKCPNCRQWSKWSGDTHDRCEHCNAILAPQELETEKVLNERAEENKKFKISLLPIHPDDSPFVVILKQVARGFQFTFMAIVSFLIWLAAAIAG